MYCVHSLASLCLVDWVEMRHGRRSWRMCSCKCVVMYLSTVLDARKAATQEAGPWWEKRARRVENKSFIGGTTTKSLSEIEKGTHSLLQ